ncbi:hypothetical protein BMS3Abin05_00133 [bacterium BMS3Abin05]|nr:hypothetical protein BMS3Abin05_00133 [bacterium BMS3Abin05]GBE27051.1 hypothetical protein BMS3Bbin03_00971 [bacterium BMS3Bbin03]HDZ13036.1 hypothetical protein [Bacteroidota bacterium]
MDSFEFEDEISVMIDDKNEHISDTLLELFLLDEKEFSSEKRNEINAHLAHCVKCQKKMAELMMFYDILKEEMQKPISENVYKMLRKINPKK